MTASHFAAPRLNRHLLASIASTVLLASGCSNLVSTAPSSGLSDAAATVGGRVHGGNQPVAGATVNLYFAGQGGPASAATLVATTTTTNDNTGSFTFNRAADGGTNSGTTNTFSCPATSTGGTPYVYVVARGGNTLNNGATGVNNAASVFIAPMGLCSSITPSTFIYMSEAVTAATVAAVHQYINVNTGDIGADSTLSAYDGLQNAFNTVSNLVSLSTGQTLSSTTLTGTTSGVTVVATPEQAKINQVANILSACINNASGSATACTTLFTNAVPPAHASTTSTPTATFTTATDVLQAAYFMFTNPTDSNTTNLNNLYQLSAAAGAPYQPTLTTVPSDWTIGVQYVATGTCGTGGGGFINGPYDLNVDVTGNIWIANSQTGNGTLSELSPTGKPLSCLSIPGGSRGGTIDSTGKVWIGDSQNSMIYRLDPTGTAPTNKLAFPTSTPVFAMAADGNGNIYYSTILTPSVWMIPGGASATAAVAPIQISTTVGATPSRILVDGFGSIWASSRNNFVSRISLAVVGSQNVVNGYSTTQFTTPLPSYGLAANSGITGSNGIYVSIQDPQNQLDLLTGAGLSYTAASGFPTAVGAAGLNVPSSIAVDGSANVWAANDSTDVGPVPPATAFSLVSEISATGLSLSADTSTSAGTGTTGGYQKASSFFLNGRSIAVDQAGNVWVGRDGSTQLSEIVGAAVPIVQPFAYGLNQGRFQKIP